MEAASGVLGLDATFQTINANNEQTYIESSAPNKIDVHLSKSTEYGTVLTLIESQYGVKVNQVTLLSFYSHGGNTSPNNRVSTDYYSTKNITGISSLISKDTYGMNLGNITSAFSGPIDTTKLYSKLPSRYYNLYLSSEKKSGDYYSIPAFSALSVLNLKGRENAWSSYASSSMAYAVIVNDEGI